MSSQENNTYTKTDAKGKVIGINGNMVSVEFEGVVTMNEVGYVAV